MAWRSTHEGAVNLISTQVARQNPRLSLIHISEPTRQAEISYAVFCLKKKKVLFIFNFKKYKNHFLEIFLINFGCFLGATFFGCNLL